ncbi:MAG: hypothetical protein F2744_08065, partial [Actinobacteria bacterium]|nr:hypothetical protein [Actinomycetota bacterium]
MTVDPQQIAVEGAAAFVAAESLAEIHELELQYLGPQSLLSGMKASFRDLEPQERKALGSQMNAARQQLELAAQDSRSKLESAARAAQLATERV